MERKVQQDYPCPGTFGGPLFTQVRPLNDMVWLAQFLCADIKTERYCISQIGGNERKVTELAGKIEDWFLSFRYLSEMRKAATWKPHEQQGDQTGQHFKQKQLVTLILSCMVTDEGLERFYQDLVDARTSCGISKTQDLIIPAKVLLRTGYRNQYLESIIGETPDSCHPLEHRVERVLGYLAQGLAEASGVWMKGLTGPNHSPWGRENRNSHNDQSLHADTSMEFKPLRIGRPVANDFNGDSDEIVGALFQPPVDSENVNSQTNDGSNESRNNEGSQGNSGNSVSYQATDQAPSGAPLDSGDGHESDSDSNNRRSNLGYLFEGLTHYFDVSGDEDNEDDDEDDEDYHPWSDGPTDADLDGIYDDDDDSTDDEAGLYNPDSDEEMADNGDVEIIGQEAIRDELRRFIANEIPRLAASESITPERHRAFLQMIDRLRVSLNSEMTELEPTLANEMYTALGNYFDLDMSYDEDDSTDSFQFEYVTRTARNDIFYKKSDADFTADLSKWWNYSRHIGSDEKYMPGGHHIDLEQIPNEKIDDMVYSGQFGSIDTGNIVAKSDAFYRPKSVTEHLMNREIGGTGAKYHDPVEMTKGYLPNNPGRVIMDNYGGPAYGGRFSHDGNFFYMYTQDFSVFLFDTSDPQLPRLLRRIRYSDTELAGMWTLTDVCMSRSNDKLIGSSLSSVICLTSLRENERASSTQIDLAPGETTGRRAIFSMQFNKNDTHILAGSSASRARIIYHDIERDESLTFGNEHRNEVNSVKFLDDNEKVVVSGSDDGIIRLWDMRMHDSDQDIRSQACFVGHVEGITCLDVNHTGTHIVSNSKDQSMKLWDVRQPSKDSDAAITRRYLTGFHYQSSGYAGSRSGPRHIKDKSLMTYRGHSVLYTTIRCGFSPLATTGQHYLYSGSATGQVLIWKLNGELIRVLGCNEAFGERKSVARLYPDKDCENIQRFDSYLRHQLKIRIVRECSWHPNEPTIYAPSLAGESDNMDHGFLTSFSFSHPTMDSMKRHWNSDYRYSQPRVDVRVLNNYYKKD